MLLGLNACSQTSNEPSLAQQKSSEQAIAVYRDAIVALNNNELEKAEALFKQMTHIDQDMAGPWANLALIKLKQEDYTAAKQYVGTALSKNPNMAQALNLSGTIELKQGKIKQAQKSFEEALRHKPNYALAHYNLALLNDIYLQDISVAVKHYKLYLTHTSKKDKQTQDWLESLEATLDNMND